MFKVCLLSFCGKYFVTIPKAAGVGWVKMMASNSSSDLRKHLREYVRGDEKAFQTIARQVGGLIYHTAFRRAGDHSCAEEVVQIVLVQISKKAAKLVTHPELLAWVHEASRLETLKFQRGELRRKTREKEAMKALGDDQLTDPHLLADLDESMVELKDSERELILMKYFQGRTFSAIAAETGRSESAEKMRLKRALEKMAGWFGKKGVTLSVAGLTTVLSTEMGKAAPVGLVFGLSGATGVAGLGSAKVGWGIALLISAGVAIPVLTSWAELRELQDEKKRVLELRGESAGGGRDGEVRTVSRRARVISDQIEMEEMGLPIAELAWRYRKADHQSDKIAIGRIERVLEVMSKSEVEELALALRGDYPGNFSTFVGWKMKPGERVDYLMKLGMGSRSVGYVFQEMELEEAREWLLERERQGELISISHSRAYREDLWGVYVRKLRNEVIGDDKKPGVEQLKLVEEALRVGPLTSRSFLMKLRDEALGHVDKQEGGKE